MWKLQDGIMRGFSKNYMKKEDAMQLYAGL